MIARQAPSGERTRLVYILAASHSGSTLLALLLGTHPQICTAGELKCTDLGDVGSYLCSCGQPIGACPFWESIGRQMRRRGVPFDIADARMDLRAGAGRYVRWLLRPLHRGPWLERLRDAGLALSSTWRAWQPELRRRTAALAAAVSAVARKPVVVDSSKQGLRLKYLLRNPGLDVKVVRLVRDGRAVALTYTDPARFADAAEPRLRGGGAGGTREAERLPLVQAAREWRRSNEEAEEILAGLDRSRWTEVRYEELCRAPGYVLTRIFEFIGVEGRVGTLDFRSHEHHVLGNGMRLDSSSSVRLDERWRSVLSDAELTVFTAAAGRMNRRLHFQ